MLDQDSISSTFCKQLLLAQIPKEQKRQIVSLFALLGSVCVKAACRTLMKLTPPAVNLINVFSRAFFVQRSFLAAFLVTFQLDAKNLYKKCAQKMLMKLTPVRANPFPTLILLIFHFMLIRLSVCSIFFTCLTVDRRNWVHS